MEVRSSLRKRNKVTSLLIDLSIYVRTLYFASIFKDWDDKLIYMATKKAYYIMDKESGKPIQIINHEKQGMY
jgi:hypothetical protein